MVGEIARVLGASKTVYLTFAIHVNPLVFTLTINSSDA